ncbi:MSMEG_1061 family FMN-dependent PPOX-type flavoprotein [Sciscionella sediminilitoris]|uniref:MSMEG_1061 family FMN-dependent PPOX-type flavoprotein n=1 Tax=Sciscionella sediminilitoris TaxID=1445613 RepID=UPI0004DF139C|nr:MSMEG_1061 family FMN-dependent PPOX-type flavoprotein [Sciscionella sp. SE31]
MPDTRTGQTGVYTPRPRALTLDQVRELVGEPDELTVAKVTDRLDRNLRRFIAHSPFVCMATTDGESADCSPRGDNPGFVKVLDDWTVAIPDRRGNKLIDSYRNLAVNPALGLIFLVPGHRETLRVNGRGYLTDNPDVLARMEIEGKQPTLAVVVDVVEAYIHCGRAVLRARLWQTDSHALAAEVPTLGEIVADQLAMDGVTADLIDTGAAEGYKELY